MKGGNAKGCGVDGVGEDRDGGRVVDKDAEGFGVDGGEGDCPFVRTWEAGVCVVDFVGGDGGERGDLETVDGGGALVELLRVLQRVVGLLLSGDG